MRSDGKSYQFDHLPVIDYDAHPAYGRVLPMPQLGARLKAIVYFGYGFILTLARRLVDIEHLPRPAGTSNKFIAILRGLPTYLRLIILQRLGRLSAGSAFTPKTERGANLLAPLQRDGATGLRLAADQVSEIRTLLAPHFATLEAKLAARAADLDQGRLWLDPLVHAEIYKWFNQTAADAGLIEAASAYLKRPVGVGHIAAQINDKADPRSPFADVAVEASPCDGFHIAATSNLLELVIYLSDVGPANGPLNYVIGSQRAAQGFWDGLIRRANDLSGLSSTQAASRELFYALPAGLQRKAAFGADLLADNKYTPSLLADQWSVTSDSENAVLFDPLGIYRDGQATEGQRSAVIIKLTELPR
ncbi:MULTISPECIES: hypothetical protein [Rhodopseudomonas]|uniref:Uncharacterized protein n=1 Tax=Rhodopseudomonas palustris TaxID=1076 RepID=A0A0D7DYH8_RHOPL|nr:MULTISPECIES: hypothetical protein [Rhodopseudomonas]KIZ33301.1 hypothetical protein OO17_28555 [Rhodopseudomonas palustris]MDF3809109.1 hypothetical protein [Rhodopseudomonas sp. BAL398]WOK16428.1 hypothetical protein RBJ75_20010 [Rhodopseudomonas sp. BAL398]